MKVLVCAATDMEVPNTINKIPGVTILIHGVGAAQTSYFLGKYLSHHIPSFAIQIGIAGSYDPTIKIGDVVEVVTDHFADFGSRDGDGKFIPIADLPFITDYNPFTSKQINNSNSILMLEYKKVNAITVNTTSGDQPAIDQMIKLYNPQIETMEGAAFLAAMELNQIPCIQIRSISNKVEPRNRENWNIPLAISELEKALLYILNQFFKKTY